MAISKTELEDALYEIEETLEQAELEVPDDLGRLRDALDKAAQTYAETSNKPAGVRDAERTAAKDEVERLRREVTNQLNERRPIWPDEIQSKLDADESPCNVIDPLYSHKFEIDPTVDLD